MTLNGPQMSRNLAQRSVVVRLVRPKYSGNWEDETRAFIREHRAGILADVAAFFERTPVTLARHTRWGAWKREVLARLPEPNEAQKAIAERQAAINADDETLSGLEDHFRQCLERVGYNTGFDAVHIPNGLAREWYFEATGERVTTTGLTRIVNQAAGERTLNRLRVIRAARPAAGCYGCRTAPGSRSTTRLMTQFGTMPTCCSALSAAMGEDVMTGGRLGHFGGPGGRFGRQRNALRGRQLSAAGDA